MTDSTIPPIQKTVVCEYSKRELALRIAEGIIGRKRPEELTDDEAMATFPPDQQAAFMRAAEKALTYLLECFANGREPS